MYMYISVVDLFAAFGDCLRFEAIIDMFVASLFHFSVSPAQLFLSV